jgi:LacI family transcriptional regulator, galactose operon repressor
MSRRVSIRDVAVAANVSLGTVSNVLNRPEVVAEDTRERVRSVIDRLGFVRNESARQLRAGSSKTIGVIVLDVGNPFFTDVARGVEDRSDESGLTMLLCSSSEDPAKELRCLHLLEEQRVRGILITPVGDTDERLAGVRERGTPVVLVDRKSTSGNECSVAVDDLVGGALAVRHLLTLGHQRIAFVGGPLGLRQVSDRLTGARQALSAAGLPADSLTVVDTAKPDVSEGKLAGERLLSRAKADRPSAVFCANDLIALGVLQVMTRERVKVPDDLAIIGYDDIDFAAAAAVPLSSIRQPSEYLGKAAAELLIEEASGHANHRHRQVTFTPELVVRESTTAKRRYRRGPASSLAV